VLKKQVKCLAINMLTIFNYDIQHLKKAHKKTYHFSGRFVYKNINTTSLSHLNNDVNGRNNI